MKMRRRWKLFWMLFGPLVVLLVVRRWDPPFVDPGLGETPAPPLAAEDNSYSELLRIGQKLVDQGLTRGDLELAPLLADPQRGWPHVEALLASNRWVFTELAAAVARPGCRDEATTTDFMVQAMVNFGSLKEFLSLALSRALLHDQMEEAAELVRLNLAFCRHVADHPRSLMASMILNSLRQRVCTWVRKVSHHPGVEESALASIAEGLERLRPDPHEYQSVLRGEYEFIVKQMRDAEQSGQIFQEWRQELGSTSPYRHLNHPIFDWMMPRLFYLPNQTRRELWQYFTSLMPLGDTPAVDPACLSVQASWRKKQETFKLMPILTHLRGNFLGEQLVSSEWIQNFHQSWMLHRGTIELTRAFVALHRYRREHGEFPLDLQALCPVYLPALPVEWFDGSPLHYDRDQKVIFSSWPVNERLRPELGNNLADLPPLLFPVKDNGLSVLFLEETGAEEK
jgi:hypothetical protein